MADDEVPHQRLHALGLRRHGRRIDLGDHHADVAERRDRAAVSADDAGDRRADLLGVAHGVDEVDADVALDVTATDREHEDDVLVVEPGRRQPRRVRRVPAFVVDPRRQLGHVVGDRVALDAGELAEVARGVGGVPGASTRTAEEDPPAAIPGAAEQRRPRRRSGRCETWRRISTDWSRNVFVNIVPRRGWASRAAGDGARSVSSRSERPDHRRDAGPDWYARTARSGGGSSAPAVRRQGSTMALVDPQRQDLRRRRRPRRCPGALPGPADRRVHDQPDADAPGRRDRLRDVRPGRPRGRGRSVGLVRGALGRVRRDGAAGARARVVGTERLRQDPDHQHPGARARPS